MAVEPRKSVHICNIPAYPLSEIEDLLFELFFQIGPVSKVFVPYDKENGDHRGYAFVEFLHEESVLYSCKMMHGIRLLGMYLGVRPAVSKVEKEINNKKMEEEQTVNVTVDSQSVVTDNISTITTSSVLPNPIFNNSIPPPCHPPMGLFCPPFPPPLLPFQFQAPPPSTPIPQAPPIPPGYPFLPSPFSFHNNSFNMTPPPIPVTPPTTDMSPSPIILPNMSHSVTPTSQQYTNSIPSYQYALTSLLQAAYNTNNNNPFKMAAAMEKGESQLYLYDNGENAKNGENGDGASNGDNGYNGDSAYNGDIGDSAYNGDIGDNGYIGDSAYNGDISDITSSTVLIDDQVTNNGLPYNIDLIEVIDYNHQSVQDVNNIS